MPVVERLWISAFKPMQRRPRCLNLQVAQVRNAIGLETQVLNGHAIGTAANPRGDTGSFAGRYPSLIVPKRSRLSTGSG